MSASCTKAVAYSEYILIRIVKISYHKLELLVSNSLPSKPLAQHRNTPQKKLHADLEEIPPDLADLE